MMWWPRPRWKCDRLAYSTLSLFVTIATTSNAAVMADEGQLCDGEGNTYAVVWTTALCTMLLILAIVALYFLYCKRREHDWSSLWWKSNSDKSIVLQTSLPAKSQQEKNGGTDNPAFTADTCIDGRVTKTGSTRIVRLPPPTIDGESLGIEISTKVEDDKPIYVCKHNDGSKDRLVALRLVFDKEQQHDSSLSDLNRALVELSRKYGLQVELETTVETAAAASPTVFAGEKPAKCAKPNILSAVRGTAQRLWQQRQLMFKGGDGRADENDKNGDVESRGRDSAVTAAPQKSSCTVTTVDETAAAAQQPSPKRGDGSLRYHTLEYGASPADVAAYASLDNSVQCCSINSPEPAGAAVSMVSAVMAAAASVKDAVPTVPDKDAVQATTVPDIEAVQQQATTVSDKEAVQTTTVPVKDAVQVTMVPDKEAVQQATTVPDKEAVQQATMVQDKEAVQQVTTVPDGETIVKVTDRTDITIAAIAVVDEVKKPTKTSNDGPKHAAASNPPPPPPPRKYSAASTASSLSHCSAVVDTSMTPPAASPAPPAKVQPRPISEIRMDDDYYWCTTTAMAAPPPPMSTFGKRHANGTTPSGFNADVGAETTRDGDVTTSAVEYGKVVLENEKYVAENEKCTVENEKCTVENEKCTVENEKRAVDNERDAAVAVSDDSSPDAVMNGGGGGTTSIEDASLPSFSSDEDEDEDAADNYNGDYAEKTKFSTDDDNDGKCNGETTGDVNGGRRKTDDRTRTDAKVVPSESSTTTTVTAASESKSPTRLPTLRLSLSSATTASCCSSSASSTSSSPTNNGSTNNNNSPIVSKIPVRRQSAGSNGTGTTIVSSPLSNGTAKKSIPLPLSRSGSRLAMWSSAN